MNRNNIIIGDFNSHNHLWGYRDDDENGLFLEEWISTNNLHLTHDSKLPNTFNSGRWKRGYNPDLACVSQNCHRTYATYVNEEYTTTYPVHNTALMGSQSTPRSPLRSSLSAVATTSKRPTGKLPPLPLTMASPLSPRHRGRHTNPSVT